MIHTNDKKIPSKYLFLSIQIATIAVFWGRAYQHLFWDAPFRTLLWDEEIMSGLVQNLFGWSWQEYIHHPKVDAYIQNLVIGFGLLYAICGGIAAFYKKLPRYIYHFLGLGVLGLLLLSFLLYKEKFYSLGQFFEYTSQFSTPIFLWILLVNKEIDHNRLAFWLRIVVALTFVCHGLYAVGYYPQPGNFMEMTIAILQVEDALASNLLIVMGILDFIVAAMIFFPALERPALCYMIAWGFLTALARIWSHYEWDVLLFQYLHQTGFEFVYRAPHFLLPLALYWKNKE